MRQAERTQRSSVTQKLKEKSIRELSRASVQNPIPKLNCSQCTPIHPAQNPQKTDYSLEKRCSTTDPPQVLTKLSRIKHPAPDTRFTYAGLTRIPTTMTQNTKKILGLRELKRHDERKPPLRVQTTIVGADGGDENTRRRW